MKDFLPGIIRVFSNITPILIFFIFAQILDIQELGMINYLIALITIVGVFTDFGIPEAIQRFLPQTKKKAQIVTYTIKLEMLIVFLGALIFLIINALTQDNLAKGYLFLLIPTFIFSASNTIILIFNGLEKKEKVSEYFGMSSLLFIVLTFIFYLAFEFNPALSFLLGRLISWGIYTIAPMYNLSKNNLLKTEKFNLKNYKRYNKFALNTFIYMGSVTIITQWDSILITNIDGIYINGIYKSVAFIATIPIVLVTILHTKLLPQLSKLNAKKEFKKISTTLNQYSRYLIIGLGLTFLLQFLIYEEVLNIFLQKDIVQQAGHLFPLIFLAVSLQIIATPYISTLQATGNEKIIRNFSIFQASTFILTSILLYPEYSYNILPKLLIIINLLFFFSVFFFSNKKLAILIEK